MVFTIVFSFFCMFINIHTGINELIFNFLALNIITAYNY